jgi:ATP-dependent RNA helicase DDX51/DBP6
VIDEADRLLAQSFQDWLSQVLAATRPPQRVDQDPDALTPPSESSLPYPDALSPAFLHLLDHSLNIQADIDEKKESSCQKLLFSATLTRDPGKIAALDLRNPKYFIVQSQSRDGGVTDLAMDKFTMPATLTVRSLALSLFFLARSDNS